MSNKAQLEILNLCKGKTIKQAFNRLEIMQSYMDHKKLDMRIKLQGITIGAEND